MRDHGSQVDGRMPRWWWVLAIAGAGVFVYLRTFRVGGVPFVAHDDQVGFFVRGLRMARGQAPYRDFFELVTPGTDLIYAAGFRMFGVHAWVVQLWSVVLGVALAWVITRIAGRILSGWVVMLPGLLFVVFDFNTALDATHHWYSTLAASGAVLVLMGGVGVGRVVVAGVLAGVAMMFTQTQGVLVCLALAGWLVWVGVGVRVWGFLGAFAAVVVGGMGWFVREAGWERVWFDLVMFPVRYLSFGEVNSFGTYLKQLPLHNFGAMAPALFVYLLVPYAYFVGMYRLWREWGGMDAEMRRRIVLLHCVGLALFLAVASAPRLHRLCMVAPPAILVLVWMVRGWRVGLRVLCCAAMGFGVVTGVLRQVQRHPVLELPVGRVAFLDAGEAREYGWLKERTRPGDWFFNESTVGFYLGLESPGASDFVNSDEYTRPEDVARVIEDLKARPPRFVVLEPGLQSEGAEHDHSGPFVAFVRDRYRLAERFAMNRSGRYEEVWDLKG
jgi:hypothetical protein